MSYGEGQINKYSHTSVLVRFRTHQNLYWSHFDKKKSVSALSACSGLIDFSTHWEF